MFQLDYKLVGYRTYNWGIRLAFVIMVGVGLRGLLEIGWGLLISVKGVLFLFWPKLESVQSVSYVEGAIGSILDGFEFLLLAPLAFVIVVSVGNYLHDLLDDGKPPPSEHQVHRVKALIISLMISIVATDLVKRFVGQQDVKYEVLVFGGGLIILFSIYFVLLLQLGRIES